MGGFPSPLPRVQPHLVSHPSLKLQTSLFHGRYLKGLLPPHTCSWATPHWCFPLESPRRQDWACPAASTGGGGETPSIHWDAALEWGKRVQLERHSHPSLRHSESSHHWTPLCLFCLPMPALHYVPGSLTGDIQSGWHRGVARLGLVDGGYKAVQCTQE